MARPHQVVWREIKERIKGKTGSPRINELKEILNELPGYNTGPYGEIKKWIYEQIEKTKTVAKIKHQDWLSVERKGESQIAIIGQPNVGKSSLINKLTGKQVKIANYAFTTLKPIETVIKYEDVEVQLIDLPGLIEGASENKGGGKRLLGILKGADAVILMHDLTRPINELEIIVNELKKARVEKPMAIFCNKSDLADDDVEEIKKNFPSRITIAISVEKSKNINKVKNIIWQLTGLIKVYTYDGKSMALRKGATIMDFAEKIHKDFVKKFQISKNLGTICKI